MSQQNLQQGTSTDLSRPSQPAGEIEIPAQQSVVIGVRSESIQYMYFAEKIGGLAEQLKVTKEENGKLRERLKTLKKENASMSGKIDELEKNNRQQRETIHSLEEAQEKLQKDLEAVSKAKDKLRIEVEEKNSKFTKENEILMERLEELTKNFLAVENENKDLRRSLAVLSSDNTSLKEKVSSIQKENEKLQNEMGELKEDHKKIQEEYNKIQKRLDLKETRLAIGQVAWILETEIWKNVLPNIKPGYTQVLYSMERWLKKNEENENGKIAQKRWNELKTKLKWNEDDHKPALKSLKDLRVGDAHPTDVDLEEASKQLKEGDYIAEPDKEFCQQIIGMINTTKSLNQMKQ